MLFHNDTDATIGLTGLPVMEDDEMRSSQQSMVWASGLSLAAVAIVIVAGFGGIRHALMANGVLMIGMAWAFAWATGSVGHLNILSVTFAVTMIGVGIVWHLLHGRYLAMRRGAMTASLPLLKRAVLLAKYSYWRHHDVDCIFLGRFNKLCRCC